MATGESRAMAEEIYALEEYIKSLKAAQKKLAEGSTVENMYIHEKLRSIKNTVEHMAQYIWDNEGAKSHLLPKSPKMKRVRA